MTDPISGTLLLDPEVIDHPYPFYAQLRARAPVWGIPGTGLFTVSTFELVAEATGRPQDFSSNLRCLLYRDDAGLPCRLSYGDAGAQALATADPPVHALHRSTVFPELVAKRMAMLEPDIADLADKCLTRALDSGMTADFMTAIGNVVPITVTSRLIGFRDADVGQLLSAAFDSTAMLGSALSYDELMGLITRTGEVQAWISGQLATAAQQPGDDILGTVARGVNDGVFGDFEANAILHTLLSAGGESTTSLLGNAVRILAEDQDLQEHLRRSPGQIPRFVEEALRLEPPSGTTCVPCPRTPHSTVSTSRPMPRSCCSGAPPTATPPSTNGLTRSTCSGRCRGCTWHSGAASTTASGPPWPASRRAPCSPSCWSAPSASPSTPSTRPGGSKA
jgi:cytochrome P450